MIQESILRRDFIPFDISIEIKINPLRIHSKRSNLSLNILIIYFLIELFLVYLKLNFHFFKLKFKFNADFISSMSVFTLSYFALSTSNSFFNLSAL